MHEGMVVRRRRTGRLRVLQGGSYACVWPAVGRAGTRRPLLPSRTSPLAQGRARRNGAEDAEHEGGAIRAPGLLHHLRAAGGARFSALFGERRPPAPPFRALLWHFPEQSVAWARHGDAMVGRTQAWLAPPPG
jgi:hypothetical protein